MQERQIQKFLAYVWALGIVPMATPVIADTENPILSHGEDKVFDADAIKTEGELQAALSDPDTIAITLANDIIALDNLVVNRNNSIELNLNGFKIASLTKNARVIDVQAGDIAILGLGSIVATGAEASAIRIKGAITADNANYSHVMIGADVTLYAPNYYGIFVTTNYNAAYGVTIDFYGSIIAHDGICIHGNIQGRGDNIPHINIQEGAKIIADENEGIAVCAFGNGIWEITSAELTGGIALNAKSGVINLRQSNLIATGANDLFPGNGATIRIEDNFARRMKLKIFSGSYLSVQGYTFYEYTEFSGTSSLHTLEIYDGLFSGQLGVCFGVAPRGSENAATRIYGGRFNADISQYLAPEHHAELGNAHGEYVVIDDTKPTHVLDKAAQLKLAKTDLEELVSLAKRYTKPSYAGNELGELQATINKIIGNIKRSTRASEKLLKSSDITLSKIKNSTRRLEDHLDELRSIENAMRAEISEAINFSKLDQNRYTPDSFLDLSLAVADAEQLLAADFVTLVELQDMLGVIDAAKIMLEESDEYIESADYNAITEPLPEPTELTMPEPVMSSSEEITSISTESPLEFPPEAIQDDENLLSPEESLLPELPLRPAPKLFPSLPEPPQATTDVEQILDTFVDAPEEPIDPIEAAFIVDDLEAEEISAVGGFIDQLRAMELLAEPLPETEELFEDSPVGVPDVLDPSTTPSHVLESISEPEPPVVPTFINPELESAKQSLRDLLNAVSTLDPADYTTESYTILARTATMAGKLLFENATHTTTAVLLSAFNSVMVAYERLAKKSENPTSAALETVELNLRSMLDAVQNLTINDYEVSSAEQFGELQVAIAKAKAILGRDLPNLQDILDIMDEIKLATSGLKGAVTQPQPQPESSSTSSEPAKEVPSSTIEDKTTFTIHQSLPTEPVQPSVLNWNDFSEALNDIRALNASEYTSESYQKLLAVLENAKVLAGRTDLTQTEIDEMVFELNIAILALERPNAPRLSATQDFSANLPNEPQRTALSSADVPRPVATTDKLTTDETITPSLLMSMMAGAYAGLATYRRSRLEAKKRKHFRSA